MKVGILCAIDPGASRVAWGGSPIDAYIRFLQSGGADFSYQGYLVANDQFPLSVDECDAYVITGSPKGVYDDDPWIAQLMHFIREAYRSKKKFVGICFGHQILAEALGGHVRKSEKGWGLGLGQFEVKTRTPWMDEELDNCTLYFAHQDQVIDLPQDAQLLGGSPFCPTAMFELQGRVLGIQGHPEFDTPIMKSILDRAKLGTNGQQRQVAAAASLSKENYAPHSPTMARWVINFLSS